MDTLSGRGIGDELAERGDITRPCIARFIVWSRNIYPLGSTNGRRAAKHHVMGHGPIDHNLTANTMAAGPPRLFAPVSQPRLLGCGSGGEHERIAVNMGGNARHQISELGVGGSNPSRRATCFCSFLA